MSNLVSATDVAQANTNFDPSTRGTCTQAAPATAYHEEGGSGTIVTEDEIQQDPKGGDNCYDAWLVTHYYRCQGNRCTYLYSTWQYLGSDCY